MQRILLSAVATLTLLCGTAGLSQAPPDWDGLTRVESKRLDLVFLQPGADFRGYTRVLIEPTEVAFHKDWQREYNRDSRSLSMRVSDGDIRKAVSRGVTAASDIFAEAWTKGGYAVVAEPGPDVLRVKTGIVHIRVNAPERPMAGRSFSLAPEAGSATLFVEVRDSVTGALLGRVVDQDIAGDNAQVWRTASSNRADFRMMVEDWANISVRGMTELKSLSPVSP